MNIALKLDPDVTSFLQRVVDETAFEDTAEDVHAVCRYSRRLDAKRHSRDAIEFGGHFPSSHDIYPIRQAPPREIRTPIEGGTAGDRGNEQLGRRGRGVISPRVNRLVDDHLMPSDPDAEARTAIVGH